jgi:hypothetical protein
MIIGITPIDDKIYSCRAMFRELTDEQIMCLKEIATNVSNAIISAVISI